MSGNPPTYEMDHEFSKPPFLYEIRVKGRLSGEQWSDWFDGLSVATRGGESMLRGSAPDRAALYGLLARLRDMAVPLVAVKVLDADAQAALARESRRYDVLTSALQAAVYLALAGGLATISVFIAPMVNTALLLALLFAMLGGLAQGFAVWTSVRAWRWIGYIAWPSAAIAFLVYLPVAGVVPVPLGIATILFIVAGGLIYLLYYLRRRSEAIRSSLAESGPQEAALASASPEQGFDEDEQAESYA